MEMTKPPRTAATVLDRIAWISAKEPEGKFFSLMHHINEGSLRDCYHKLDGKKAVGADGITKEGYGENLAANLEELISRMKRLAYRPGAVREVLIPKEGKRGATRALGISNFEDKLVQKRMQELLNVIYEPIFIEQSYGFRPNRSCHDAIKAVHNYLYKNEVTVAIDVDLANYFGTIDHDLLTEMLGKKIKDRRFIRYIRRMFKAGVLANGELCMSPEGVPQGSCVSPLLANIYAHYVIDEWVQKRVKHHVKGKIEMFRYADDMLILCQYEQDAIRIRKALANRLAKYKLELNESKTNMVAFSKRASANGIKQQTFDFLGFTFYIGKSRKGRHIPKLKTSRKRFVSKLKKCNLWIKENRNRHRLRELWKQLCAATRGHIQYYGVSFNARAMKCFIRQVERLMFKWLNRRSQKKSFTWKEYRLFLKRYPLPAVKICHNLYEPISR